MKAGWTTKRLEELVEIRLGRTPPRAEKKFWDPTKATDNTWVSIADLSENEGGVITESKEHLSKAGADSTPLVKAGTLLVSFKLSLGKVAIAGKDLRTNEAIAAMPIKGSGLDVNWLKYFFQFFDWDKAAVGEEKVKGKALNKEKLKEIEIPLPPLAEQKRIVELLDKAFAGIDEAKVKTEANLENAKALSNSHVQAIFNQGAEGWRNTRLEEISTNLDSKRVPITKNIRASGEFPYYGASGIVDYVESYIFEGDNLLVSEDGANLLARSTPIAFSVTGKYWVNNHAHILHFENMATQRFVEFYLESIKLDGYITGAAQPKLTQKALNSIPIPIPDSIKEQGVIVRSVESLKQETTVLSRFYELKMDELKELKSSLLSEAFAGELTA